MTTLPDEFDTLLGACTDISPHDRAVTITTFSDVHASSQTVTALSVRDFVNGISSLTAKDKAALPLFKLARFGNVTTDRGSLRHDDNLVAISGIVADYDAGKISIPEAAAMARAAGIAVAFVASPSHTSTKPRWRAIAPLEQLASPDEHARMCARLNGAMGGALASESFTTSQSYFYGRLDATPELEVAIVDGQPLDRATDLDVKALGRDGRPFRGDAHTRADDEQQEPFDAGRAQSALAAIPATDADDPAKGGRDLWLNLGMALFHGSGGSDEGFALWDAWSKLGAKYGGERDQRRKWKSFARASGKRSISLRTLYRTAGQYGWVPPETAERQAAIESAIADLDNLDPLADAADALLQTNRLRFFNPAECAAEPSRGYIVKGLMAPGDVGCIYGAPGAGKSLISPHIGYLFDKSADRYRTADELEKFIAGRVGDTGQAQSAGVVEIEKLLEQSRRRQDEFNEAVARGNAERERGNDALTIQNDLVETALIAAQREATITKAVSDLQARAAEANKNLPAGESPVTITPEQIARTRDLAAAEFDLQNARALAQAHQNQVERPMRGLEAEQQALRARVELLRDLGDTAGAQVVAGQLDEVNAKLRASIDAAIAFYEALDPETDPLHRTREEIDATVTALQNSRDQAAEWGTILGESARSVAQSLANDLEGALDGFAQRIAEGTNAFRALKLSFLDFASNFLRTIVQMIQQQVAFNIVRGVLSAVGMGVGSAASAGGSWFSQATAAGFTVAHTGGVIGNSALPSRQGDMSWLKMAARYHTGGIAGLKPNEVPAILERGEEVLTRADARHRDNGGAFAMTMPAPKIVNLFDAESAAQELLNTRAGEKAMLNIISKNPRAVKASLA